MEERTIRGVLEYNGKEYPFVIENRILTIVQHFQQYYTDFRETVVLGTLLGLTDTKQYIIMLNCRILSPSIVAMGGSIQIGLDGYVLQSENDDGFDQIGIYSPALRAFYPAAKAWRPNQSDTTITLTTNEQTITRTYIEIDGEVLQYSLNFGQFFNYRPEEQHPLTISPIFSITFSNRKKADDLAQYLLYVLNFLCLMNFRANIPFEDIVLYRFDSENALRKVGNAVIFQTKSIDYTPDFHHSIVFADLGKSAFAALFKDIAEQTLQQTYNPFFLPRSKHDLTTVDSARWLVAAISFEGEFDKAYANYKAEQYPEFHKVKELLLSTINNEVERTGLSINNKKNKYYNRFFHLIDNFDTTIREKFIFTQKIFKGEFEYIVMKYCQSNAISPTTDFADVYEKTRNQTAHGAIRRITPEGVVVFQLLRCFIYLLILERAGVPSEKREEILKKLF